nr:MAG TPA: hypothetical protein [Caudoviricetes sp.]
MCPIFFLRSYKLSFRNSGLSKTFPIIHPWHISESNKSYGLTPSKDMHHPVCSYKSITFVK